MTRSTTLRGNQKHPKKRAFSGTPQHPAALQERILPQKHIHTLDIESVDMPLKNITNDKH